MEKQGYNNLQISDMWKKIVIVVNNLYKLEKLEILVLLGEIKLITESLVTEQG